MAYFECSKWLLLVLTILAIPTTIACIVVYFGYYTLGILIACAGCGLGIAVAVLIWRSLVIRRFVGVCLC